MAGASKNFDWEGIEREYRANQLSISEISKRYGLSRKWIWQRAGEKGWRRELAAKVHSAFKEKIVRADCDEALGGEVPKTLTDTAIIEGASARKAEILQCHRRDISGLRQITKKLSDELDELHRTKSEKLDLLKKSSVLLNLTNSFHKLIVLERQAFSLDEPQDTAGTGTTPVTDALLSELAGLRRRVEETEMPPEPDDENEEPEAGRL